MYTDSEWLHSQSTVKNGYIKDILKTFITAWKANRVTWYPYILYIVIAISIAHQAVIDWNCLTCYNIPDMATYTKSRI